MRRLAIALLLVALAAPAWAAAPTRIYDLDPVELPQVGLSMIVDAAGFDRAKQLDLADLGETHGHTVGQLTDLTASAAELNLLDGATATAGGLLFGDGTKLTQSAGLLRWDAGNSRLEAANIKVLTGGNLTVENGKVGIGTAAPEYALQVGTKFSVGTDGVVRWGGDVRSATYAPAGYLSYSGTKTLVGGLAGQHLGLVAGAVEKATLTTAGWWGCNTTSPVVDLTIKPTASGGGIFLRQPDDARTTLDMRGYTDGATFRLFNGTTTLFSMDSTSGSQLAYWLGGNWGFGTNGPTAKVDINSDIIRLRTAKTPASASATGNAGDICWDSNYIYACIAANTWKRAALSTW